MSDFTTTHDNYDIYYDEGSDKWKCSELKLETNSLGAMRGKINDVTALLRRTSEEELLLVSEYNITEVKKFRASLIDKDDHKDVWGYSDAKNWGKKKDKVTRIKVSLKNLVVNNEDNRKQIEIAVALSNEASALTEKAREIMKAIPRVTADYLLVQAKEKDL